MDLNRILCVGRTDMYGGDHSVPKQHFHPSVSSFDMDSLRYSVRKDRSDSRSPSRYSSHSPNSRSILRDTNGSPKQSGSPCGYRNVRFTDRHSSPESSGEFSRLHVKEMTQTNGGYNPNSDDKVVQVYTARNDFDNTKRSYYPSMEAHYDHIPDEGFNSPPMSASTPRQPNDRSPSRNNTYSRMNGHDTKQQRELPKTPIYRDVGLYSNHQEPRSYQHSGGMGVCKQNKNRSSSRSPTRSQSMSTQTSSAPNGQKIIQNMGSGGYSSSPTGYINQPNGQNIINGLKIIQNMDLGKVLKDKSIGVQTGDIDSQFTESSVQTQTAEEDQGPKDASVQTPVDEECQTPIDIGVQTPVSVEIQTSSEIGIQTANDDDEEEEFMDAFVQTLSDDDDEEFQRDVSVQTPREVGVQTPRSVSIQTSVSSDEDDDTANVAIQTQLDQNEKHKDQNLDIQTSVWSNVGRGEAFDLQYGDDDQNCSSILSSGYKKSRPIKAISNSSYDDYEDSSEDEDIQLPSRLTKPFPKREPINYLGKLKSSGSGFNNESKFRRPGFLTDHSAKDLLEKQCIPSITHGAATSFCRGRDASRNKSTSMRFFRSENDSDDKLSWQNGQTRSTTIGSQYPEMTTDIGTQFHSDYHLELQKQQERKQDISDNLDFTPVEFHSFDPGKLNNELPLTLPDPIDIRESFNKNSFIKDVNLGPPPMENDDRYNKNYRDGKNHSPTRTRLVKKVNFNDYPSTNDYDYRKPKYIFFKRNATSDRYGTFDPSPLSNLRKPRNYNDIPARRSSYMSPPRPSYPRPSSAPPARQSPTLKASQLTPTLSHLRKHAIRKRLTDNSNSQSRSNNQHTGSCGRSDTFISSTKPEPQPLTLPLSDTLSYCYPDKEPTDVGSFEISGNQPRQKSILQDSSNLRPKNRDRSISPSPNGFKSKINGPMSSNKPPIPRGRPQNKVEKHSTHNGSKTRTEKETVIYPRPADNRKSRSRSTESQTSRIVHPSKKRNRSKSRDQSTDMDNAEQSHFTQKESYRVANRKLENENSERNRSVLFGNEAVQKIIEKANLKN